MEIINSSQRSYLKSQAHHLNPVAIIGKNGLNDVSYELDLNGIKRFAIGRKP